MGFWEEAHRGEVRFPSHGTASMTFHADVNLDPMSKVALLTVGRFLCYKVTFLLSYGTVPSSEGSHHVQLTNIEYGVKLYFPERKVIIANI